MNEHPVSELRGKYIDEIAVGMSATFCKTVTESDVNLYAGISGDTNPLHLDEAYARTTIFKGRIAHGMLTAGFISAAFGARFPGPGSIYMSQSLKFTAPVRIGDTVLARVTARSVDRERGRVTFATTCHVEDMLVLEGEAMLMVPKRSAA